MPAHNGPNSPRFNDLVLFALFVCNGRRSKEPLELFGSPQLGGSNCERNAETEERKGFSLERRKAGQQMNREKKFKTERASVPLHRAFEVNLYDLFGIVQIKPPPVGLPAFRDHLNAHATQRCVRNVRHSILIRLDVDF